MVSIGFPGGLQLFTWAFQKEVITTPIIGGAETSAENPSWSYTLGGTEFSEFGILIPGGGSSYTDIVATIIEEWQSPVYRMNVPVGAKLKVIQDHWGMGASTRPEWQFRFREGVRRMLDTAAGFFGEIVAARPLGGQPSRTAIQGGHSWPFHRTLNEHGFVRGASEPSLVLMPDGREILGVLQDDGYFEYESFDTQRTWRKVGYPVPDEVRQTVPAPIFEASVQMPQLVRIENIRLALARRGSALVTRRLSDEGVGDLKRVAANAGEGYYSLSVAEDGTVYICDETGLPRWQSDDAGLLWISLPAGE
jgi:hypothetical protein